MSKEGLLTTDSTEPTPLALFSDPRDYDVYFGRGNGVAQLPGNKIYRQSIKANQEKYQNAKGNKAKNQVAFDFINAFKNLGGTFYRQNQGTNQWVEASLKETQRKVMQALRERPSSSDKDGGINTTTRRRRTRRSNNTGGDNYDSTPSTPNTPSTPIIPSSTGTTNESFSPRIVEEAGDIRKDTGTILTLQQEANNTLPPPQQQSRLVGHEESITTRKESPFRSFFKRSKKEKITEKQLFSESVRSFAISDIGSGTSMKSIFSSRSTEPLKMDQKNGDNSCSTNLSRKRKLNFDSWGSSIKSIFSTRSTE